MNLKKHRIRDFLFFSSGIFLVNLFIGIAYYTIQGDFFADGYFPAVLGLLNIVVFIIRSGQRPVIGAAVKHQPAMPHSYIVFPRFLILDILYAVQIISGGTFIGIFAFLKFSGLLKLVQLERAHSRLAVLVNKFHIKDFSGNIPIALPVNNGRLQASACN